MPGLWVHEQVGGGDAASFSSEALKNSSCFFASIAGYVVCPQAKDGDE
jgi:hypothetical protein